ncbi:MAG: PorT family protein [Pseudoflavonifractor sp.]|nr:PorT family protein [Pseudoflavonifractor sp.]
MIKKLVLLAAGAACVLSINAQSLRWGVEGGLNLSRPLNSDGARAGFNVGVKGELGLISATSGLYLDAALKLSSKPARFTETYGDVMPDGSVVYATSKEHDTPYYLDIPIHVGYKFGVARSVKLFAAVGPYFAAGLFGSAKVEMAGIGGKDREIKIDNLFKDNPYGEGLKRFDVGLSVRMGAEFIKHVQFSVGYDLGFIELQNSLYNQNISLSVGYMF